jgi:predicted component of type VI protein secretion system
MHIRASFRRLRSIAPWVALGPFTGLLGWRMERSLRAKNRALAVLYGLAIVTTSALLVSGIGQSLSAWFK